MKNKLILSFFCVFIQYISCHEQYLNDYLQMAEVGNNILQIFEVTAIHGFDSDDVEDNSEGFEYVPEVPVAHIVSTKEIFVSRRPNKIKNEKEDNASLKDPYWKYRIAAMKPKEYNKAENLSTTNTLVENIHQQRSTSSWNPSSNSKNVSEINKTNEYPINTGFMKRLIKSVGQKVINNQEHLENPKLDVTAEWQTGNKEPVTPIKIIHIGDLRKEQKGAEKVATQGTEGPAPKDQSELIKKFHAIARQALPFAYVA